MSVYGEATTITIHVDAYAKIKCADFIATNKVAKSGDTMTGILAMRSNKITGVADPTTAQDAATKSYDDFLWALKLAKAGDAMSGLLAMGSNKITGVVDSPQDDAIKNYVDLLGSPKYVVTSGTIPNATNTDILIYTFPANKTIFNWKIYLVCESNVHLGNGMTVNAENLLRYGHTFTYLPEARQF